MEETSMTQRTKAKFEQLFKLALDEEKLGSSLLRKSRSTNKLTEVIEDNDVETNKVASIKKRKKLKEKNNLEKQGLINHGFAESEREQLDVNKKTKESCVIEFVPQEELTEIGPQEVKTDKVKKTKRVRKRIKDPSLSRESNSKANLLNDDNSLIENAEDEIKARRERRARRKQNKKEKELETVLTEVKEQDETSQVVRSVEPELLQAEINNSLKHDDDCNLFCVKIHRVDKMKLNVLIKHPLVRVHIVNGLTGDYLKKSKIGQKMILKNDNVDYILPSITSPFDMKKNRSFTPVWEEQLLFNESFDYITKEIETILFFEILDFLPMATASNQYGRLEKESGWYHVAWGFLKVMGTSGILNVNRVLQLQLFNPPRQRIRPEPKIVPVFQWWKSMPKVPYSGSLFVTLFSVAIPKVTNLTDSSTTAVNDDLAVANSSHRDSSVADPLNIQNGHLLPTSTPIHRWSRLPGQSCKIPNILSMKLATVGKGCFATTFSRDGRLIACGCCQDNNSALILIYELLTGNLLSRCQGHSGLIYEVSFSSNDAHIVSASADGTARVWTYDKEIVASSHILPHLSYVYCAQYHPVNASIIVTGCFDHIIRIWILTSSSKSLHGNLAQELESHDGHINTLCFDKDGSRLFSGDHLGVVCVWINVVQDSNSVKYELYQVIKKQELLGVTLNQLQVHPISNHLLIHSRDSSIRLLDLNSLIFTIHIKGFLNLSEKVQCCISPCGNYIFSGSEDHQVYVWNSMTGDQVGIYSDLPFHNTVHCVIYHPYDHILAVTSYKKNNPVLIYKYDFKAAQLGVSLVQSTVERKRVLLAPIPIRDSLLKLSPAGLLERKTEMMNLTELDSSSSCLEKIIQKLDSVMNVSCLAESTILNDSQMSCHPILNHLETPQEASVLYQVIAEHDYVPRRSDELCYKKGDLIDILVVENDMWLIGKLIDGRKGYIDANYVSKLDNKRY